MAFKMKGHSIPGIKGFKGTGKEDGRAASSAFQMQASPFKGWGEAVAYQESIGGKTMDELVAQRKDLEHDKTSLEYRQLQDKINLAYAGGEEGKYRKLVTPEEEIELEGEIVAEKGEETGFIGPELPPGGIVGPEEVITEEPTKEERKIANVTEKFDKKASEAEENKQRKLTKLAAKSAKKEFGKDSVEYKNAELARLQAKFDDISGAGGGTQGKMFKGSRLRRLQKEIDRITGELARTSQEEEVV